MGKRYWDDLTEGERFTCRPVAFDREGIVAFGPVRHVKEALSRVAGK